LPCSPGGTGAIFRKKTAETIQQETRREVEYLLRLIFCERRKNGRLDLEVVEIAVGSAMHQAGAAALSQWFTV
jgi:hypothetical protein